MIRKMKRVYIMYIRDRQDELIERLQKLGVLHIEEVELPDEPDHVAGEELSDVRRDVENLLIKARGILDLFAEVDPQLLRVSRAAKAEYPTRLEDLSQAFREELETLEGRLRALVSERRELRERLEAIERFREVLRAAEELLVDLPTEGRRLVPMIGEAGQPLLSEIEETLQSQLAGRFTLRRKGLSEGRVLVLVSVDPDYVEAVHEYLEAKGLRHLGLPTHVGEDFQSGIAQLLAEETILPRRLTELDDELQQIARRHADRLVPLTAALENRLAQLDAALRFGYTDFTLLVTGWLPADEDSRFRETLAREFPGIVIGEDPQPASREEIPVAFVNSSWARPYQLLLDLMGLPKYGTIDPSLSVSLFFPVFFGLIVGDFGYGLVLVALSLFGLRRWGRRNETLKYALLIALQAAGMTVFFGIAFGEFFGFVMPWPHILRGGLGHKEAATSFLVFAVALGAIQVVLGFVFGAINALRERSGRHFLAKVGAILTLAMIGVVVGVLSGMLPETLRTPGFALLAAAVVLLIYGEGFLGLLEVFSYVGHVISYARIMGFGLASAVLAELVNEVGGATGNVVLGVLVGITLHAAHLVLDTFEATIQSARLHLVEFFQKFYEAGGRQYEPLREVSTVKLREEEGL
jgi:V/A-type H+-transporting ATPase subunit I